MIYELLLTRPSEELSTLSKVAANWPILGFKAWLKQMSQSEGQKRAASKLMQPLDGKKEKKRDKKGIAWRDEGAETMKHEKTNLELKLRDSRGRRELGRSAVGALGEDLKTSKVASLCEIKCETQSWYVVVAEEQRWKKSY